MADKDNRQGPFARVLQKHAGRAKERLLQNLGKADRTTDEDFDLCVKNFNKQQNAVMRLQKEFKNYHQCLKAMQASRKSLMDTVCELYEPCWIGLDKFLVNSEVLNQNFEDFCEKINNQLLTPVTSYISQFPELNNKISKRNRKLLDYDNCRHNLQNLETMKKREEAKITKAKEQLEEAQNLFEVINSELHDELPALYDSRVSFFVSYLQCLYLAEAHFHNQDSVIFLELNGILESLDEASKKTPTYIDRKSIPSVPDFQMTEDTNDVESVNSKPECYTPERNDIEEGPGKRDDNDEIEVVPSRLEVLDVAVEKKLEKISDTKCEEDAKPSDHRILYQVQGTYKYTAEDVDELSFNVGDIIDVISYDDPEEQEEGWLMGVFNGKKGLFPANFTSRI